MQSRQEVEYRGSRESVDDKRKESKEEKLTNKMPVELEGAASRKIKGIAKTQGINAIKSSFA